MNLTAPTLAFDELECFDPAAFDDEYANFICQVVKEEDPEQSLFTALPVGAVTRASGSSVGSCMHVKPQFLDIGIADKSPAFDDGCAELINVVTPASGPSVADCNHIEPQLMDLCAADDPEFSDLVAFGEPECFDPAAFDDEYAQFMCQEGAVMH